MEPTICVSIGRGRHKHMIAEHKHLVEQGAKLVELRLDYIRRTVNLKRLLGDRPCPVIATCRRQQDGGKWEGTEDQRLILLRSAIAEGVEYVDLEDDIANIVPRYGKTKRVISIHNFRDTPKDLDGLHSRLADLDPDIIKIASTAQHPDDNIRMLNLVKNSKVPTVGLCMGDIGVPTRILSGRFGAPFTFATFHSERALAPGQLSYRDMKELYRYESINSNTKVFGVIADPVGHSLSPVIHNVAFKDQELNSVYVPFRVPREGLRSFMEACPTIGVGGLSVTIPHKEAILSFLSKVDDDARQIGAVNTVVIRDGKLIGYNTDLPAAMDSLAQGFPSGEPSFLKGRTVLILGAGGAAKAIAYGVKQKGGRVVVSSRTLERAEKLAEEFDGRAVDWDERHGVAPDVLINATPVGMHPNMDESPFMQQAISRNMVVFDTIYNPEQTLLIKEARNQGCTVITGVDMFVRQAAMQFKLFTKANPPMKLMRTTIKRATGAAKY